MPKTNYPDWAAPYTAVWRDGQWMIPFPNEEDAKIAYLDLQAHSGLPFGALRFGPLNAAVPLGLWIVTADAR